MTDLVTTEQHSTILEMQPADMVTYATKVSGALCDIIEKQKLYNNIQGRKYVKVEGWLTLGSMLGIFAREKEVHELKDGSFLAVMELFSLKTGKVVSSGSALCGVDEARWGKADRYARRSMAITRATGKAYRMAFSWIMALAGYEGTPEEEMPHSMRTAGSNPPDLFYDNGNVAHQRRVVTHAKALGINDQETWAKIGARIGGADSPVPLVDLAAAVKDAWEEMQQ